MTEKEFIKTIKPRLLRIAQAELNSPRLSQIKVHDLKGASYKKITFVATCQYTIAGQKRKEIYHCRYDGQLSLD